MDSHEPPASPLPHRTRRRVLMAAATLLLALIVVLSLPKPALKDAPPPPDGDGATSAAPDLATLEQLFKEHPTHAPIALQLGQLYSEQGRMREAASAYRRFLEIDTSAAGFEVRQDLAKALFALGESDAARAELQQMLARNPGHPGAIYNLGAIEANLGNVAEARRLWSSLAAADPNDPSVQLARAGLQQLNNSAKR